METPSHTDREHVPGTLLSVSAAAAVLGRSKWAVYGLIRRNRLTAVREGRRLFLDTAAIHELIPAPPAEPAPSVSEPPEPVVAAEAGHGQRELTMPRRRGPFVVIFF